MDQDSAIVGIVDAGARRAWCVCRCWLSRRAALLAPQPRWRRRAHPAGARRGRDAAAGAATGTPIKVLFLGTDEETPHNPAKMFPLLAAPLARRGIQLTYGRTPAEALDAGEARVLRRA